VTAASASAFIPARRPTSSPSEALTLTAIPAAISSTRFTTTAAEAATSAPTSPGPPIRTAWKASSEPSAAIPTSPPISVVYLEGGWYSVGGTSWATPTFAGIVNAAGHKAQGSIAELSEMYKELANPTEYAADFNDITQGASQCGKGFDKCTGIGSPKTYTGK